MAAKRLKKHKNKNEEKTHAKGKAENEYSQKTTKTEISSFVICVDLRPSAVGVLFSRPFVSIRGSSFVFFVPFRGYLSFTAGSNKSLAPVPRPIEAHGNPNAAVGSERSRVRGCRLLALVLLPSVEC